MNEQIMWEAMARLEFGNDVVVSHPEGRPNVIHVWINGDCHARNYPRSHDDVQRVLRGLSPVDRANCRRELGYIVRKAHHIGNVTIAKGMTDNNVVDAMLLAKPEQWVEAILRATGLWEEE